MSPLRLDAGQGTRWGFFLRHLPNALTLLRILLLPWLLFCFDSTPWRLGIFLGLVATDLLDGWLARRWRAETRLGAILDPLADKLLILALLVAAFTRDLLPTWMLASLLLRDLGLLLLGLFGLCYLTPSQRKPFQARLWGKAVTGLQFASCLLLVAIPSPLWKAATAASLHPYTWGFWLLYPLSSLALWDYACHFLFAPSPPPES